VSTWNAESPEALQEVSGVIHDAYFDAGHVRYDHAARLLSVPFAQEWGDWWPLDEDAERHDAPRPEPVRKTWRYTEERVPFMRGLLRVRHVTSFTADAEAGDAGTLLGVRYDAATRRLTIDGVSGNLAATVENLEVTAELRSDEVALHVARRHGWLGSSSTPLGDRSRRSWTHRSR
jgi:hypothetical protein